MVKFEKLKSLQNKYISKYPENYFSNDVVRLNIDDHNLNIKEKGKDILIKVYKNVGLNKIS